MIKIRIRNADHEIDIRFPISESELFAKLGEIHAVEGRDAAQSALVTDVYWPEEFSMLKDRFANLDELNYLGKRMESFDTLEYDQFLIGISKLDSKDVKDLINLTFNLNHFTLCQDVSSYGKIGREYVLNTEGAVPAHDEDDPKYATIGKDLIDRGLAQITERGLLIYNPFDELEEVYDGHTFPEYYYNNSLLSLNAEYGGRTELLQLPDEALAIKKAIDRLGAPSAEDCSYTVTFHNFKGDDRHTVDEQHEIAAPILQHLGLACKLRLLRNLIAALTSGDLPSVIDLQGNFFSEMQHVIGIVTRDGHSFSVDKAVQLHRCAQVGDLLQNLLHFSVGQRRVVQAVDAAIVLKEDACPVVNEIRFRWVFQNGGFPSLVRQSLN